MGDCLVHLECCNIPSLHPLDARSTPNPIWDNHKCTQIFLDIPWGRSRTILLRTPGVTQCVSLSCSAAFWATVGSPLLMFISSFSKANQKCPEAIFILFSLCTSSWNTGEELFTVYCEYACVGCLHHYHHHLHHHRHLTRQMEPLNLWAKGTLGLHREHGSTVFSELLLFPVLTESFDTTKVLGANKTVEARHGGV